MENKLTTGQVTVLIPTYKRPEKLKRAVASVFNQTYQDFKIIISDNASGDDTENVVKSLINTDSRIEYFKQNINIGMNENFNFLVSKVNTPFFCLLSDDDYYLPTFLKHALKSFSDFPDIMFSVLSGPAVTETGKLIVDHISKWPREGFYNNGDPTVLRLVTSGQHPTISACLFRKEISSDFYFDSKVGFHSDLPILIILTYKFCFTLIKKTGMYFVIHSSNLSAKEMTLYEEFNSKLGIWNYVLSNSSLDDRSRILLNVTKELSFIKSLLKALAKKDDKLINIIYEKLIGSKVIRTKLTLFIINISRKSKLVKWLVSKTISTSLKTLKNIKSIFNPNPK
jgi:glycosyltransferase involved in cell wall biosynthesis